jgi:hypothetical protein
MLSVPFRNTSFHDGGVLGDWPNLLAGGPPLIGYPLLLTQYILSYTPHLEVISFIRNIRTRHAVMKEPTYHSLYIFICNKRITKDGAEIIMFPF